MALWVIRANWLSMRASQPLTPDLTVSQATLRPLCASLTLDTLMIAAAPSGASQTARKAALRPWSRQHRHRSRRSEVTQRAQRAIRSPAFALLRFQSATMKPASRQRPTMPWPIRPSPMKPTRFMAQSTSSTAPGEVPKARCARVAAMNSSRSPSSTPEVSEVCTPVRRSLTI
jgi:hypothetical protein